jgi:hypothetical protein
MPKKIVDKVFEKKFAEYLQEYCFQGLSDRYSSINPELIDSAEQLCIQFY